MPHHKAERDPLAWIGHTDLKSAAGDPEAGSGPIA